MANANEKTLDDKISEVINGDSWIKQVKTTLEVSYEIVKAFNELNEHYRNDLERFNANFDKSQSLYDDFVTQKASFEAQYSSILNNLNENLAKSEILKSDLDAINANIKAMNATITSQKDEIQALVNSLDINDLNAKIADLNTKKTELTAFLPQFDAKKDELKEYLTQTKNDFEQYIADFRNDLDELDFVQTSQPNTGLKGQSWLDTSKGLVNIFSQNPQIRFFQENEPQEFAKLGNGWVDDESNHFIFKESVSGNEWVKLHLISNEFNSIEFKQLESPEANAQNEGKAWLKMSPLNVYYLENKSFVQIDKKLVRFESESEPNLENETIQLNDIWKKSDDEIFICTQYTAKNEEESIEASAVWTPLNEAYKIAKFQRSVLPGDDEIANDDETLNENKVQMRDLVFVFDANELYHCVKNNYQGGDDTSFVWVKKSDFNANARFKTSEKPQELKDYDWWYKIQGNGGELYLAQRAAKVKLMSLKYVKKYAHFRQENEPSFAFDGDYWFKPFSNVLYRFEKNEWIKIEPLNSIYYKGSHQNEIQLSQDELEGMADNEHENGKIQVTIYDWERRLFNGVYNKNAQIINCSNVDERGTGAGGALGKTSLETVLQNNEDFNSSFYIGEGGISRTQTILLKEYDWLKKDNFTFYNNIVELDDDEIFLLSGVITGYNWQRLYEHSLNLDKYAHLIPNPLLWQNELEKRVSNLEKLHLPNGSIYQQVLNNELVVPTYPQQLANKAYVDDEIFKLEMQMKTSDNDFILCDLEQGLNFYLGKNLKIVISGDKSEGQAYSTTNTYTLKTLQDEADLQGRLEGQSGSIVIENANFLNTTLGERFVSRVALSALSTIEIFSYSIYNGKIYLSRL